MDQNSVFRASEADAWYRRNQAHLQDYDQIAAASDVRYILDVLHPFKDKIGSVLEIGCGNGIKLEVLCHELSAKGTGIEPSVQAVEAGNNRVKKADIALHVGTGDRLPCDSQAFDLVYFAFCLYLFDRSTLLQALVEADRVLKPGGFLVITDFDPGLPCKRRYAHFEGIYSYKQNYADYYTQNGVYYLAGKKTFSHHRPHFDEDANERVATSILYKEFDPYPIQE